MDDKELEAWRAKRMAEMQQGSTSKNEEAKERAEEQRRAAEDMKNSILSQILSQSARARLNTLMIGKPEKGQMVENMLVRMAQTGQIMGKLQEEELINILEQVNKQFDSQKKTTVKYDRRRVALDDSDDEL